MCVLGVGGGGVGEVVGEEGGGCRLRNKVSIVHGN